MCTLIAIKDRHPSYPLIVAANRDELYSRASTPPRRVHEAPLAVAGVDLEKGGSWMGANACGLVVALTNQRTYRARDHRRASRGEVVLDALAERDVEAIDQLLQALDPRDYNGFNLLYGDAERLRVAYARPDRASVEVHALGPGVWVLPNDRIGSPEFPKTERAEALVAPLLASEDEALFAGLHAALSDHDVPGLERIPAPPRGSHFVPELLRRLQALCIHSPFYGTKSSTVVALGPSRVERYLFADGPPCEAPYRDLTSLFS